MYGAYKKVRNQVNVAIKKAKTDYASEEVDSAKGDGHRTWRAINMLLGKSQRFQALLS